MSTDSQLNWVDLLRTAKTIRRSVRPVRPSARFRRHLRSDLASALGATVRSDGVVIRPSPRLAPSLVFGACLGLCAVALALIMQRGSHPASR